MFQTDLHLWLQAFFNADWMLPAMTAVSALGYAPAYILLIAVCAFGIGLRPGLGLMLAIVLMSGVTSLAKHAADLPRPSDIDARVLDKGRSGRHLIEQGTVPGFWSLPSEAAIARYRADEDRDPGLPSGHVGVATAATVAVLLAFAVRNAWWRALLLLGWPALMALSRMYLGRHFLADVLAGWLLGIAVALLAVALMPRPHPVTTANRWRLGVLGGLALAGIIYASQHTWLGVDVAGQLAGLTVVLCWLQWRGWPPVPQKLWQRLLGPVLFIGLNLLAEPVISPIAGWLPLPDVRATEVWWHFVGTASVLIVAITLTGWINARHRPVDSNRQSTEPRARQLSAAMTSAAHPQHIRETTEMAWTFDQGPDVACLTCQAVLDGQPVRVVTHYDDDHSWAFLDGSAVNEADARVVAMRTVLQRHPELEAIAHLPPGLTATRSNVGDAWVTAPNG